MKTFVVTEIWTRQYVIKAETEAAAYDASEPASESPDLNLSNWHVVEVPSAQGVDEPRTLAAVRRSGK